MLPEILLNILTCQDYKKLLNIKLKTVEPGSFFFVIIFRSYQNLRAKYN